MSKAKKKNSTITFYLPKLYKNIIKDLTKKTKAPVSDLIRNILHQEFARVDKELKKYLEAIDKNIELPKKTEKMSIVLTPGEMRYLEAYTFMIRSNNSSTISNLVIDTVDKFMMDEKKKLDTVKKH